ncbi:MULTISPECIES: RNA polymerase sigma factor [Acetobacter]|uniref:RNA polymerase sigma factor n=1 Tax=Acetobacter TaxID=434 RepID=UPI0039E7EEC4
MKAQRTSWQLYEAHRENLLSYANRLCGDKTLAEDIVQDAWLLFSRQQVERITSPLHYLRTIVRNLLLTRGRRVSRAGLVETDFDIATVNVEDQTASPEASVAAREVMRRVFDVINLMPERQRDALMMYHFKGMKLREIAAHLGVSHALVHRLIADGVAICDRIREEGL